MIIELKDDGYLDLGSNCGAREKQMSWGSILEVQLTRVAVQWYMDREAKRGIKNKDHLPRQEVRFIKSSILVILSFKYPLGACAEQPSNRYMGLEFQREDWPREINLGAVDLWTALKATDTD